MEHASGYSATVGYYEGFDVVAHDAVKNSSILIVILGDPENIQDILRPPESLEWSSGHFHFEFEPETDNSILLAADETVKFAFLDGVPVSDVDSNLISTLEFPENDHEVFSVDHNDTVVLMTADETYFLLGNISQNPDFTVSFDYQEINFSQVPEPATLALLGLGLLTITGYVARKRFGGIPSHKLPLLLLGVMVLAALFIATTARAETEVKGMITENTTWTQNGSPYVVTEDVIVGNRDGGVAVLTIEPGVEIRFAQNTGLIIGQSNLAPGALSAQGMQLEPIVFTLNSLSPYPGAWKGIYFNEATQENLTIIDHCIIEYGGARNNASVYAENAYPTIQNSTIRYSSGYPIRVRPNNMHLRNLAYEKNLVQATWVADGTIDVDTTWENEGDEGVYVVTGDIRVANKNRPVTLTIKPGTEVRFEQNTGLYIAQSTYAPGALFAQGTQTSPIIFTANSPTPLSGSWEGIYFRPATIEALTVVEYCIVEYGGTRNNANIFLENTAPAIQHNIIQHSSHSGVRVYGSESTGEISCNVIENNRYGVSVTSYAQPEIHNNNFVENEEYGIYNENTSLVLNANNNWWEGNGNIAYGNVTIEPMLAAESGCASNTIENFVPVNNSVLSYRLGEGKRFCQIYLAIC